MLKETGYDREVALQYARQQAVGRNSRYLDSGYSGGDCADFVSQRIYAEDRTMNYTSTLGRYYNSSSDRSPSWTGVGYLYRLLAKDKSVGSYGAVIDKGRAQSRDIVQLGNRGGYYYGPTIVAAEGGYTPVTTHSYGAYMRLLDSYVCEQTRFIHIQETCKW